GSPPRPEQAHHLSKRGRSVRNELPGMHLVGRCIRFNKRAQIDTGLAVRRQPHHFPLIAVALKPEVLGELAVEISNRVWKRNRQNVLEPPIPSVPNRS